MLPLPCNNFLFLLKLMHNIPCSILPVHKYLRFHVIDDSSEPDAVLSRFYIDTASASCQKKDPCHV